MFKWLLCVIELGVHADARANKFGAENKDLKHVHIAIPAKRNPIASLKYASGVAQP